MKWINGVDKSVGGFNKISQVLSLLYGLIHVVKLT